MYDSNARALTRATYSLDTAGVLAHLRDTARASAVRVYARLGGDAPALPRARVGPARGVVERHNITDAWRLR